VRGVAFDVNGGQEGSGLWHLPLARRTMHCGEKCWNEGLFGFRTAKLSVPAFQERSRDCTGFDLLSETMAGSRDTNRAQFLVTFGPNARSRSLLAALEALFIGQPLYPRVA
jgi:hypothetical protein